jgi:hypothetical protein
MGRLGSIINLLRGEAAAETNAAKTAAETAKSEAQPLVLQAEEILGITKPQVKIGGNMLNADGTFRDKLAATLDFRSGPIELGHKSGFARSGELESIPQLKRLSDGIWKYAGGPGYGELKSMGLKPTDHILAELTMLKGPTLFNAGEMERPWTKRNMAALDSVYRSGHATQIEWFRLPEKPSQA